MQCAVRWAANRRRGAACCAFTAGWTTWAPSRRSCRCCRKISTTSAWTYPATVRPLAHLVRVIALGCGVSTASTPEISLGTAAQGRSDHRPSHSYTFLDYIEDIDNAVRELDWDRFDIMGHSMGAGISYAIARSSRSQVHVPGT